MYKELLQLPNLISLSRVAMAPLVGYFLAKGDSNSSLICLILLMVAGITDGLDGYLARRMGKVSQLGIALDPIADKIFAGVLVILLIIYREFPIWLAALIVGRDVLILGAGSLLLRGRRIVVPSNLTGKYTFAAIAFLLGSYVIRFEFGITLMTYLSLSLLALSTITYARVFVLVRSGKEPPVFLDRSVYRTLRVVATLAFLIVFFYKLYGFYF